MIEVEGLQRSYGKTKALRGVSFSVPQGEVVGLLGPNGAGKTTMMKILVGALLPDSGSARVAGHDVVEEPLEVQRRIGYLPENAPLYHEMLAQDYLLFVGEMHDLEPGTLRSRLGRVIDQCRIAEVLTRPIGHLSKGFRQRVGLASALLHDPPLLILDEPTSGLDPNQIVEVRELIRGLAEDTNKTVILSTHILPEVEASCGRAIILIDGMKRADGTLHELTRSSAQIVTVSPGDPGRGRELLETVEGVRSVTLDEAGDGFWTYRLDLRDDREVGQAVAEVVRQQAWPLRELRRDDCSLEQVFRELTEAREGAAA